MPWIIGVDEAGYGPNLGPLVIAATLWKVPRKPQRVDLWSELEGLFSATRPESGDCVWVADSKVVYSPAQGLLELERSILHLLALAGHRPATSAELWRLLDGSCPCDDDGGLSTEHDPWFTGRGCPLPVAIDGLDESLCGRLMDGCRSRQIELVSFAAQIVVPARFNRLVAEQGSKGRVLSQLTMELVDRLWPREFDEPTLVLADRHGGRARYLEFLQPLVGDRFIRTLEEHPERSRYGVGQTEVRFQVRSEEHLPVALASMTAKYMREVSMRLFNAYWVQHQPGLRPTAGYPGDAMRFYTEIAPHRAALGIQDHALWRCR